MPSNDNEKKLIKADIDIKNKMEVAKLLSTEIYSIDDLTRVSDKVGGSAANGKINGVYSCTIHYDSAYPYYKKEQKMLVKHAANPEDTMREYVAGVMMNALVGNQSSSAFLLPISVKDGKVLLPDATGKNVVLASVYYDTYQEILRTTESGKSGRIYFHEYIYRQQYIKALSSIENRKYKPKHENFYDLVSANLQIGNFDFHGDNCGTANNEAFKLLSIDPGAGLKHLESDVHIHSHSRHLPGFGPVNHFRNLPREMIISEGLAAALLSHSSASSRVNIQSAIDDALAQLDKFYGPVPLVRFARQVGVELDDANISRLNNPISETEKLEVKKYILDTISHQLKYIMNARLDSSTTLAYDIKLSLACEKDKKARTEEIVKLIKENPAYFFRGDYHFRSKKQQLNLGLFTIRAPFNRYYKHVVDNVLSDFLTNSQNTDWLSNQILTSTDLKFFEYLLSNKNHMSQLSRLGLKDLLEEKYAVLITNEAMKYGSMSVEKIKYEYRKMLQDEPRSDYQQQIKMRWHKMRFMPGPHVIRINEAFLEDPELLALEKRVENNRRILLANCVKQLKSVEILLQRCESFVSTPALTTISPIINSIPADIAFRDQVGALVKCASNLTENISSLEAVLTKTKDANKLTNKDAIRSLENAYAACSESIKWLNVKDATNRYKNIDQPALSARQQFMTRIKDMWRKVARLTGKDQLSYAKKQLNELHVRSLAADKEHMHEMLSKRFKENPLMLTIINYSFLDGQQPSLLKRKILNDLLMTPAYQEFKAFSENEQLKRLKEHMRITVRIELNNNPKLIDLLNQDVVKSIFFGTTTGEPVDQIIKKVDLTLRSVETSLQATNTVNNSSTLFRSNDQIKSNQSHEQSRRRVLQDGEEVEFPFTPPASPRPGGHSSS